MYIDHKKQQCSDKVLGEREMFTLAGFFKALSCGKRRIHPGSAEIKIQFLTEDHCLSSIHKWKSIPYYHNSISIMKTLNSIVLLLLFKRWWRKCYFLHRKTKQYISHWLLESTDPESWSSSEEKSLVEPFKKCLQNICIVWLWITKLCRCTREQTALKLFQMNQHEDNFSSQWYWTSRLTHLTFFFHPFHQCICFAY